MDELGNAWRQLKAFVDDQAHQRQHYLDFFERAEAAYLVTDGQGRIVEINGATVDLLDRRRRYLRGKPMATLIAPAERREFRSRMLRLSRADRWRGTLHARDRRLEVEFSARLIPGQGICWRLQPVEGR